MSRSRTATVFCECANCGCGIQFRDPYNILRSTKEPWCICCSVNAEEELDPSDFIWKQAPYPPED